MERETLERALEALARVLDDRDQHHELVVVGGGSLLLTGFVVRPTEDLDVVALGFGDELRPARPLPAELTRAVEEVGRLFALAPTWLNAGPTSLLDFGLPEGFAERVRTERRPGLVIHHAGRLDQICLKTYAATDRGPRSKHFDDLRALSPTADELRFAEKWGRTHDPSEPFADQLRQLLAQMGVDDDA